ncbi:hypothetical protein H8356DRAFT_1330585 [Neocallimastix lanati (nom. inval.)]|nr:hypothetical protein H8356DRAFT_1330585 [Neocallimastix sp. JGI-2020a]
MKCSALFVETKIVKYAEVKYDFDSENWFPYNHVEGIEKYNKLLKEKLNNSLLNTSKRKDDNNLNMLKSKINGENNEEIQEDDEQLKKLKSKNANVLAMKENSTSSEKNRRKSLDEINSKNSSILLELLRQDISKMNSDSILLVVNPLLNQRDLQKSIRRKDIIYEMIDIERDYVNDLSIIINNQNRFDGKVFSYDKLEILITLINGASKEAEAAYNLIEYSIFEIKQSSNPNKSPPRIIKSLPSRKIYSMISNENQEEDKNEEDEGMIISPKKKKKKKRETKTNEVNTVFENKK